MYNVPVVPNNDSAFTFLLQWDEWLYCQWNLWQGWKGDWFWGGRDDAGKPTEIHRTQNCTSLHIKNHSCAFLQRSINWLNTACLALT